MIRFVVVAAVTLFPVSEIALSLTKRSRGRRAQDEDQGSLRLLWLGISLGIGLAIVAQWVPSARLPGPRDMTLVLALILLLGGLALRWAAILTLGRLFTVDVAIQAGHVVVRSGPYRFIRHPSYTGLLLAFLGLGMYFANWLSIFVLMLPITLAVTNRVVKEERTLLAAFGADYAAYCARTRRFIPGLF